MLNETDMDMDMDADPQINETLNLEELKISSTQNPSGVMPPDVGSQDCLLSEATCLEEQVVDKFLSPTTSEKVSEKEDHDENSAVSVSGDSDRHTQDSTEFPFPPVLFREKNCKDGTLTLLKKPDNKVADYDSDTTCSDYVECGEKGVCKCQRMRGRNYYAYYVGHNEEYQTLYSKGRCVLPKGTILHFTGAPDTMKREDVLDALVTLGARVEFVDYQRGSKEGWVRLSFAYEARIIIKKMTDQKLNVIGADLSFSVLSGADEKRYHKIAIESIYRSQENAKGISRKLKKAGYRYVP